VAAVGELLEGCRGRLDLTSFCECLGWRSVVVVWKTFPRSECSLDFLLTWAYRTVCAMGAVFE